MGGRARISDGKSDASDRPVALDSFTVLHLRRFVDLIDSEREALGRAYPDHDYLMVGPEGRPLHPDTITARFNRLVDKAGVPRIRLHDLRHTYSTMALDEDLNVETLSERIGHADVGVTLKVYTHKSPGKDRPLADHMGRLIAAAVDALDGPLVTNLVTTGELDGSEISGAAPDRPGSGAPNDEAESA